MKSFFSPLALSHWVPLPRPFLEYDVWPPGSHHNPFLPSKKKSLPVITPQSCPLDPEQTSSPWFRPSLATCLPPYPTLGIPERRPRGRQVGSSYSRVSRDQTQLTWVRRAGLVKFSPHWEYIQFIVANEPLSEIRVERTFEERLLLSDNL